MKIHHDTENRQINVLDERFYLSEERDEFYPSVTTVLEAYPKGPGFTQWLKQVGFNADEIVKQAGEEGSIVHNAIERFLKGHELRWIDDEGNGIYKFHVWQMIMRFHDFFTTYNPEIIHIEQQIVDDELRLGGTLDFVCRINGETWLIDFKSSNAIYESYWLQIAKYMQMWQRKHLQPIDRYGILWLKAKTRGEDKTGKKIQGKGWQLKESPKTYKEDIDTFEALHMIWRRENPNYKPKNMIYPDSIKLEL